MMGGGLVLKDNQVRGLESRYHGGCRQCCSSWKRAMVICHHPIKLVFVENVNGNTWEWMMPYKSIFHMSADCKAATGDLPEIVSNSPQH